jgi:hypothetical protein
LPINPTPRQQFTDGEILRLILSKLQDGRSSPEGDKDENVDL